MNSPEFKPPTDPALRAIWIIRNWTQTPIGNMQSYADIVHKVNQLASEVFDQLHHKDVTKELAQ